ncbi:hypothetical protein ACN20G_33745 (plasmid) [Streptomyces sp. BI20]|uniref:hypothetical protein n=1 Tax=Streptomyces sp. BI20 TaxID=3403460 RepID=UPI003C735EEB
MIRHEQVPDETPIHSALVRERGDVPAQVRAEAERLLRETERVIDFRRGHAI